MSALQVLRDPGPALGGDSAEDFLRNLGGPRCLLFTGADTTRCRAFVTLLHGNEPSGLLALRHWLLSGRRAAVNVVAIVASVRAALATPLFSQRMPHGERDLNRCFRPPFADAQGRLAQEILAQLAGYAPEAVVDMHNTSGSGPAFGVVNHPDPHHDALLSLFTRRQIVSPLMLGALMERSSADCPIVTVEVGGRADEQAHELARDGLARYFLADDVLDGRGADATGMEILTAPIRLELRDGVILGYGDRARPGCHLTLRRDIELYNFGTVNENVCLGWTGADPRSLFRAVDGEGRCAVNSLLTARDGRLSPARPLKLFMITSNAAIAHADCLCYAVAHDGDAAESAP